MKLLLGDCLDKLKELEDNSVDSIVTDPPYGLSAAPNSGKTSKGGFMGKTWDYDVPSQEIWEECLRVLKPGGHLLAFAGSRTYHRMAVRIEDAGFEIRDQIMWVYGSGFPKSMDISKQIDKREGAEREVVGSRVDAFGDAELSETDDGRNLWGKQSTKEVPVFSNTATSDLAKEWNGWGTALKPAHEPIVMARKPLSENTVVDNVLEWGTGGINIDESRIPFKDEADRKESTQKNQHADFGTKPLTGNVIYGDYSMVEPKNYNPPGRFPANIIFDEEAGKILDEQSGTVRMASNVNGIEHHSKVEFTAGEETKVKMKQVNVPEIKGGASRFFYCPKTSKTDRNEGLDQFEEKQTVGGGGGIGDYKDDVNSASGKFGSEKAPSKNHHPTVKPTDLMLYLIRLITPKGGTTLDPFMGSGSTGKGAVRGGFDFIGIEREKEYFEIAQARIDYEQKNPYIEETGKRIETNENAQKFW